jgi:hypothetical protein
MQWCAHMTAGLSPLAACELYNSEAEYPFRLRLPARQFAGISQANAGAREIQLRLGMPRSAHDLAAGMAPTNLGENYHPCTLSPESAPA